MSNTSDAGRAQTDSVVYRITRRTHAVYCRTAYDLSSTLLKRTRNICLWESQSRCSFSPGIFEITVLGTS